jgi:UDP-N-acetylmuramoyl-tripeptide--D-alanyl-D-alanine ligase
VQLTASDIARRIGGEVVAGDGGALARSFSFDSRSLEPGACFVALVGGRDGHDFVADALASGATVAIVQRVPERASATLGPGQAIVRADDPQSALHALARSVRDERLDLDVIAITGSSGKTSTKDLLHAALSTTGAVHANPDSFNNEVGLPLTLLGVEATTRYVVTEMGARFAGNIKDLGAIARPTVGIVTNVGLAHAEHLGGLEGVARVKAELVEALPSNGLAVLNADDAWSAWMRELAPCPVVTVGMQAHADVRITEIRVSEELRATCRVGDLVVDVPLRGAHQVSPVISVSRPATSRGVSPRRVGAGGGWSSDGRRRGSRC